MKLLLVGAGGREHALAWRFTIDDPSIEIVAAPGNPGIAELARCVPVAAHDVEGLLALAEREAVDVTVVGPEAPLAAGIVDRFRDAGRAIFGPTREAAELETSKAFAKALLRDRGIPTAAAELHTSPDDARAAVRRFGTPVVIKASGLAAGKGVVVAGTVHEADVAIAMMLEEGTFGAAGAEILVEEFMEGEELSLFVLTDGMVALPLLAAQDHKRLLDGDRGPNTGGMGAYAPVSVDADVVDRAMREIVHPTLTAMRELGRPFTGLLYAGLMLTNEGPKVVEFNCRFGDPETEAVLPLIRAEPTLLELVRRIATGEPLPSSARMTAQGAAVTTVLAAAGYPERPVTGAAVSLPPLNEEGVFLFHAGTSRAVDGSLHVAGGRVFAVTAVAPSFEEARRRSTALAERIAFEGKQYRRDIGWRESARRAGTT